MTTRRLVVVLLVLLICAALAFLTQPRATYAAASPTPAQLSIYVRGWIDGAAPPGVYVTSATCTAAHVCTVRLSDGNCARATVAGYAFPGPWQHCAKQKKGPKS